MSALEAAKTNKVPPMGKQVGFNLNLTKEVLNTQNQADSEASSLDRISETRHRNSQREFNIRRSNKSKTKNKPLKSPSDFTNVGAKSVVSMFSGKSAKTNNSAPLGFSNSMDDSPSKAKKKLVLKKSKVSLKAKKKIRPSSSTSPGYTGTVLKDKQLTFNLSAVNFHDPSAKVQDPTENTSLERSDSLQGKKIIPLKNIKFPKKNVQSSSSLPKPPLHKKQTDELG